MGSSSGLGLRSSSFRLWLRVFLLVAALALACSAMNVNDGRLMMEERSLSVSTNDYGDPSANPGHEPRSPGTSSGGKKGPGSPKRT